MHLYLICFFLLLLSHVILKLFSVIIFNDFEIVLDIIFDEITYLSFRFDPFGGSAFKGGDIIGEKKRYHDDLKSQVTYKEASIQQRRKDEQARKNSIRVVKIAMGHIF